MGRTNGSAIRRGSDAGRLNGPFIQYALSLRGAVMSGRREFRSRNLGTMRPAHNPRRLCCSASDQWAGGGGAGGGAAAGACAPGSGNGDPPAAAGAAAVVLGVFGFFGRINLWAGFGSGPTGWSSAAPGLGSIEVVAGVVRSPGTWTTCTATVAGWNLFRE